MRRSVWIVGGDGWAYDIGYGGLDHVLASGRNVNILVLDTEVYSNTGGQASKSTPRGAVAKFAAGGKRGRKKDLGLMAVAYGNVYVAQIAMGASPQQTVDAFLEAEAHDGPSLIIAYSHCIAHGINMRFGMRQQKLATECGHWPLYRYKPASDEPGRPEFRLDSSAPSIPIKTYAYNEIRYKMLAFTRPEDAAQLLEQAQQDAIQRWNLYKDMAERWPSTSPGRHGMSRQPRDPRDGVLMNLTTRYMGLTLKNPLVASASPLSQRLETIRQLEDCGASAVVMFSLFEEQIRHDAGALDYFMSVGTDSFGEALSYFPVVEGCEVGPTQYLELIRKASAAVDIPIIASLNGTTDRGWIDFATLMEEAGAKAIELNIYYIPTAMHRTGAQIEEQYLDVVARVKSAVSIPVAVKVGPYFSSFAHMAGRLDRAGADALVLFNRFYQPDFDIESRTVVPALALSTPEEIRLPLLWIALAPRPCEVLAGRHDRRAQRGRSDQVPDGGRECGDEHVGAAAARSVVAHRRHYRS